MKAPQENIQWLNRMLYHELILTNQNFLHARMFKNWGLKKLDKAFYQFSIHAMKRADRLINRIFFLEGLPNLQDLGHLSIGEETKEILDCEYQSILTYHGECRETIAKLEQANDFVSRELLEHIADDIEEQIDWLEIQFDLLSKVGKENYLQSMMKD